MFGEMSQVSFQNNIILENKYFPNAKRICGDCFFGRISGEKGSFLDTEKATDICLVVEGRIHVAFRVRQNFYYNNYKEEFTLRTRSRCGNITEIDKVRSGCGDFILYCFENELRNGLCMWTMINLDVWRKNEVNVLTPNIPNGDGTYFSPFNYSDFPKEIIYKQWEKK